MTFAAIQPTQGRSEAPTADFCKVVRIGTIPIYQGSTGCMSVFCKIEMRDGRLSITGVEGPRASGNCIGGCGQINESLPGPSQFNFAEGWTPARLKEFVRIWGRWHLNDMRSGSPAQNAHLTANDAEVRKAGAYPGSYYQAAKDSLSAAGLQPDVTYLHNGKPYSYGSAWLREDVPAEILAFLRALPDADKAPAWV